MIPLVDKTKVKFFDYFFLLSVIIYAGQASGLVRQFGDVRTLGNSILLLLTIVFAFQKKVKIDKELVYVVAGFSIYSALAILATGSSQYFMYEYSRWMMIFFVAFVICRGYGYRFFAISETILLHLAVIAIVCWIILLIVPVQFANLLSNFSLEGFNTDGSDFADYFAEYNVLFYTINGVNHLGQQREFYSITRNAGFAWEPGAFACFMCFAVFFNTMRTGFRLKQNKALLIFIVALLSTQSTTGYATFAMMAIVWVGASRKLYWMFLLIPLILLGVNLPFIGEKIAQNTEDISTMSLAGVSQNSKVDRLVSFKLLWEEFLMHPLFGYAFSESQLMKFDVTAWSGIGKLLAQYGIIMSAVFFYFLKETSKMLNRLNHNLYGYVMIVAFLGMMVSYNIWNQPFFTAIWLSCLFMKHYPLAYQHV